jgi:hypothetical protein
MRSRSKFLKRGWKRKEEAYKLREKEAQAQSGQKKR